MSGVTATKTESYTYGDSNWKDKLTAFGRSQFAYDAIGNPISYKGYTLTWQNGRQLASLEFGPIRLEYTYDVDGLRTSKNVANVEQMHKYYYAGSRLQYETIGETEALMYFYDADGNPSGIRYINGEEADDYYFVCNWRGDVMQVYNASGVLVASYEYDAWGKVIAEKSTDADTQNIAEINPIRYRGYYFDTETRLYYLKSRYYDPVIRRFLNADGLISTGIEDTAKNMFAYCLNNSVIYADPEGDCPYKPNSYDFYRLNNGLPPAECTCNKKKTPTTSTIANPEKVEEKLYAVMESVEFYVVDQYIASLLAGTSISSITSNILLEGIKNLSNSLGIASAMCVFVQIAWDFEEYGDSNRDFIIAAGIDVTGVAAAMGIACLIPAAAPTVAVAVISVVTGYGISVVTQKAKDKYLKKSGG